MNLEFLQDSLTRTATAFWERLVSSVPSFAAALLILILGYLVSRIARKVTTVIARRFGFDRAAERIGMNQVLARRGMGEKASDLVGSLVFWFFMLIFLLSATEVLGLAFVSQAINRLIAYVPLVIGAVVIFVVGLLLAEFVRSAVRGATQSLGQEQSRTLSKVVWGVLVVVVSVLAIGQLQIDTAILGQIIQTLLIAAGVAIALALGLGTREIARNVVTGIYARELHKPGHLLEIGGERGTLHEIGTVKTTLENENGDQIFLPNEALIQAVVRKRNGNSEKK